MRIVVSPSLWPIMSESCIRRSGLDYRPTFRKWAYATPRFLSRENKNIGMRSMQELFPRLGGLRWGTLCA